MGVSISPRLPYELLLLGGAGRAKGLGGPVAPALMMEFALGDGGGRTTPDEECVSVLVRAGVAPVVPDPRGDDSAVWLPFSESSGICNMSRGFPDAMLLVRDTGTIGTDDAD